MATPESKERERLSVTTISHGELSGRQQGACGPLMVLTELMTASLQSSSLSHCPAGLLQNWCTQALDNISGFVTAIILYYSLKYFFLSCFRSVKCILAKEKEEIPSPKSFQHRERAVCSSAETVLPFTEKKGEDSQPKSMQEGSLLCSGPESRLWQCPGCAPSPLAQKQGGDNSAHPASSVVVGMWGLARRGVEVAMERASYLELPYSFPWELVVGGNCGAPCRGDTISR